MIDCPACGKQNPAGARFCVNCGAQFQPPPQQPQQQRMDTVALSWTPGEPPTAEDEARAAEPSISSTPTTSPLSIDHGTREFSPEDFLVMVVDDMTDNLVMISLHLQHSGYRVVTAADGEEAIKVAALSQPDMILMDIGMPGLDGLGATRKLRENQQLNRIPVIAVTAFETDGFRRAAYEAGFDGYLTKPLDFQRLDNLIRNLLPAR